MSIYDWSKVPNEINWIATDEDKTVCHYVEKPIIEGDCDYWTNNPKSYFSDEIPNQPFEGNWKDSLEERPK